MVEFEIRSKKQSIGTMKDKTVYYIHPKAQQHMTNQALVERIVRETSLSAGDVSNALISLSNVVCDALRQGMSVDLADLGALRLNITSKMMDQPEKLTVNDAVNTIHDKNTVCPQTPHAQRRQTGRNEHRPHTHSSGHHPLQVLKTILRRHTHND